MSFSISKTERPCNTTNISINDKSNTIGPGEYEYANQINTIGSSNSCSNLASVGMLNQGKRFHSIRRASNLGLDGNIMSDFDEYDNINNDKKKRNNKRRSSSNFGITDGLNSALYRRTLGDLTVKNNLLMEKENVIKSLNHSILTLKREKHQQMENMIEKEKKKMMMENENMLQTQLKEKEEIYEREYQVLQGKIHEMEKDVTCLKDEIHECKEIIKECEERKCELEEKVNQCGMEIEVLKSNNDQIMGELTSKKSSLNDLCQEISQLTLQFQDNENEKAELMKDLEFTKITSERELQTMQEENEKQREKEMVDFNENQNALYYTIKDMMNEKVNVINELQICEREKQELMNDMENMKYEHEMVWKTNENQMMENFEKKKNELEEKLQICHHENVFLKDDILLNKEEIHMYQENAIANEDLRKELLCKISEMEHQKNEFVQVVSMKEKDIMRGKDGIIYLMKISLQRELERLEHHLMMENEKKMCEIMERENVKRNQMIERKEKEILEINEGKEREILEINERKEREMLTWNENKANEISLLSNKCQDLFVLNTNMTLEHASEKDMMLKNFDQEKVIWQRNVSEKQHDFQLLFDNMKADYEEKVRLLNDDVLHLRNVLEFGKKENDSLSAIISNQNNTIIELNENVQQQQGTQQSQLQSISVIEKNLNAEKDLSQCLRDEISRRAIETQEIQAQSECMKNELKENQMKFTTKLQNVIASNHNLLAEKVKLEEELKQYIAKNQLNENDNNNKEKILKLENELADTNQDNQLLMQTKKTLEDEVTKLIKEIDYISGHHNTKQRIRHLQGLKEEVTRLQIENQSLEEELSSVKKHFVNNNNHHNNKICTTTSPTKTTKNLITSKTKKKEMHVDPRRRRVNRTPLKSIMNHQSIYSDENNETAHTEK